MKTGYRLSKPRAAKIMKASLALAVSLKNLAVNVNVALMLVYALSGAFSEFTVNEKVVTDEKALRFSRKADKSCKCRQYTTIWFT